jgi:hypothetical protein
VIFIGELELLFFCVSFFSMHLLTFSKNFTEDGLYDFQKKLKELNEMKKKILTEIDYRVRILPSVVHIFI